jgi:radical SAM protein with 4Fe4S-binding SPASM domain
MTSSRLARSFLPWTAVLEMTYQCNHRCLFCSCPWEADGGGFPRGEEMAPADWCACIDKVVAMGATALAFTGGEPLLKPGIESIIEHAAGCVAEHIETKDGELVSRDGPPDLYLISNGGVMERATLDFAARVGLNVSLSLPGLETYPRHTRGGDPNRILGLFRVAHELGVRTTVNIAVTRLNLPELFETIAEALLAGADSLLLNRFLPGGRGLSHLSELSLTREQVIQALDIAEDALLTANRWGHLGTEVPRCLVDPARYERIKVGTRCSAAVDFFVIGPSGRARVCNHSPVELMRWEELETAKDHPYWRRFAFREYLPTSCGGCPEMGACDAGCREAAHVLRGAPDAHDPLWAPEEVPPLAAEG